MFWVIICKNNKFLVDKIIKYLQNEWNQFLESIIIIRKEKWTI